MTSPHPIAAIAGILIVALTLAAMLIWWNVGSWHSGKTVTGQIALGRSVCCKCSPT